MSDKTTINAQYIKGWGDALSGEPRDLRLSSDYLKGYTDARKHFGTDRSVAILQCYSCGEELSALAPSVSHIGTRWHVRCYMGGTSPGHEHTTDQLFEILDHSIRYSVPGSEKYDQDFEILARALIEVVPPDKLRALIDRHRELVTL